MMHVGELIDEDGLYYFVRSMVRDFVDPQTGRQTVHAILKSAVVQSQVIKTDVDIEETLRHVGIKIYDKRLTEVNEDVSKCKDA